MLIRGRYAIMTSLPILLFATFAVLRLSLKILFQYNTYCIFLRHPRGIFVKQSVANV